MAPIHAHADSRNGGTKKGERVSNICNQHRRLSKPTVLPPWPPSVGAFDLIYENRLLARNNWAIANSRFKYNETHALPWADSPVNGNRGTHRNVTPTPTPHDDTISHPPSQCTGQRVKSPTVHSPPPLCKTLREAWAAR